MSCLIHKIPTQRLISQTEELRIVSIGQSYGQRDQTKWSEEVYFKRKMSSFITIIILANFAVGLGFVEAAIGKNPAIRLPRAVDKKNTITGKIDF